MTRAEILQLEARVLYRLARYAHKHRFFDLAAGYQACACRSAYEARRTYRVVLAWDAQFVRA